jgi:hypothetical protein
MALLSRADRTEARRGKPSGTAKVVKKVLGV